MQKSQEGRCFIEAQSSVHQRSFIIEVGRTISIQSHVLKNDLKEPNYGKSLISEKLRWDPIGVHWVAETSRTLEIRSLLANIFDETSQNMKQDGATKGATGRIHTVTIKGRRYKNKGMRIPKENADWEMKIPHEV